MMDDQNVLATEAAAATSVDITDEQTVIKTMMTPRIDELVPCCINGNIVETVNVVNNARSSGDNKIDNNLECATPNNNNSGDEKFDADPEHSRKSCDVTPDTADEVSLIENMQLDGGTGLSVGSPDELAQQDNSPTEISKSAMAFTIDFNEGKQVDAKKYNDIFERFQKRHRRGASMSKLDDPPSSASESLKSKPPPKKGVSQPPKSHISGSASNTFGLDETNRQHTSVTMRDKSRLSRKDAALTDNRHSWSPRNSLQTNPSQMESNLNAADLPKPNLQLIKPKTYQPKSETLQRAFESIKTKGMASRSSQKSDCRDDAVVCEQPPLEYRPASSNDSVSSVSEAGTYTLDGDNYTEEQKEQMSIDKMSKLSQGVSSSISSHIEPLVAEHQFEKPKSKTSYLERIKSKVKNISDRTFHKNRSPEANEVPSRQNKLTYQPSNTNLDHGNFTSVTSAGVFSKYTTQEQITPKVKICRKGSLTKSQVDSSEYIQKMDEQVLNSFTDYEKARHNDYQLNIFAGQLEPECISYNASSTMNNDSYGIDRAETKNDWIQEWAKNARRNTRKKSTPPANNNMHRNSNPQYDTSQATSSSDFSDVNSHARMTPSCRRNVGAFNDSDNYTNDTHRFEMRSATGRQQHQLAHNEPHLFSRLSSGRRGSMNNVYNLQSNHSEFGDDLDDDRSAGSPMQQPCSLMLDAERGRRELYQFANSTNLVSRPPLSPTKIPSPLHSLSRPRSSSVSRSIHSSITDLDTHNDDTGMYLHKTAAAISQLQSIHRKHNSPQSPSSPHRQPNKIASNFMTSPSIRRHYKTSPFSTINTNIQPNSTTENHSRHPPLYSSNASLHKRNHSLDIPDDHHPTTQREQMFNSYNSDGLNALLNLKFSHSRHNSYEDKPSPVRSISSLTKTIDQTFAPQIVQRSNISIPNSTTQKSSKQANSSSSSVVAPSRNDISKVRSKSANVTPASIKRSSSFSTKPFVRPSSGNTNLTPKMELRVSATGLQKSASSTSFKNMSSKHETDIYLNQNDDLYANFSSESEISESGPDHIDKELLTNTRYNKAFLARLEQNKQKATSGPTQLKQGVSACPNTPELPRRDIKVRQSLRDRASMPRDSSINRMKQDLTTSISAAKKHLTDSSSVTANRSTSSSGAAKVLPKYLDISKYKPTQGNTFLKRNESKSTLNPQHKEIKRSNSSFGVGMQKSDAGRSSIRSAKSASGNSRTSMSAVKDDATREADLAMWRRRASYDPMKAAAEGKRKLEEKKITHASKYNESSSAVLRSKSYHSGVGQSAIPADDQESGSKRWTLISTESSDEEFADGY